MDKYKVAEEDVKSVIGTVSRIVALFGKKTTNNREYLRILKRNHPVKRPAGVDHWVRTGTLRGAILPPKEKAAKEKANKKKSNKKKSGIPKPKTVASALKLFDLTPDSALMPNCFVPIPIERGRFVDGDAVAENMKAVRNITTDTYSGLLAPTGEWLFLSGVGPRVREITNTEVAKVFDDPTRFHFIFEYGDYRWVNVCIHAFEYLRDMIDGCVTFHGKTLSGDEFQIYLRRFADTRCKTWGWRVELQAKLTNPLPLPPRPVTCTHCTKTFTLDTIPAEGAT